MSSSTKNPREHAPDQTLADRTLRAVLGIPEHVVCARRTRRIRKRLAVTSTSTLMQCTVHTRCGNLGCLVCRRRTQLVLVSYCARKLRKLSTTKKRGDRG